MKGKEKWLTVCKEVRLAHKDTFTLQSLRLEIWNLTSKMFPTCSEKSKGLIVNARLFLKWEWPLIVSSPLIRAWIKTYRCKLIKCIPVKALHKCYKNASKNCRARQTESRLTRAPQNQGYVRLLQEFRRPKLSWTFLTNLEDQQMQKIMISCMYRTSIRSQTKFWNIQTKFRVGTKRATKPNLTETLWELSKE